MSVRASRCGDGTYVFELGVDVIQRIDDTIFVFSLMFVNGGVASTRLCTGGQYEATNVDAALTLKAKLTN